MNDTLKIVVLVVVFVVVLTVIPFATLWMLNTLFSLSLPYTVKYWSAALLLNVMFAGSNRVNTSK